MAEAGATLGLLLLSGTQERAQAAFLFAAGGAALGRTVVLFATGRGCLALCEDWGGLEGAGREAVLRERGVAGLAELRAAAVELGVRLIACDAGLRGEAVEAGRLMAGVEVAGVATWLAAVGAGQVLSF